MLPRSTEPTSILSLREAQAALFRVASLARYGLFAAGLVSVLYRISPLISDAQFTWGERLVSGMIAVVALATFGLAGWAVGLILRAGAAMLGAVADASEAAVRASDMIEAQLVPAVLRISVALESLKSNPIGDPSTRAADDICRAIDESRWGLAERLLDDLARTYPHSPHQSSLASRLAAARQAEAGVFAQRLDAALADDDPGEAIACRDALTRHLQSTSLRDLDSRVARWLSDWVRARIRRGDFTPRLAEVATIGADRFGDTTEGRSLLAAVPDLRRRAGLCITCAEAYQGAADACPACSKSSAPRPRSSGSRSRGPS